MIKKRDFTAFNNCAVQIVAVCVWAFMLVLMFVLFSLPNSLITFKEGFFLLLIPFVGSLVFGTLLFRSLAEIIEAQRTAVAVLDVAKFEFDLKKPGVALLYFEKDGTYHEVIHRVSPMALSEMYKHDRLHKVLVTKSGKCYLLRNNVPATEKLPQDL